MPGPAIVRGLRPKTPSPAGTRDTRCRRCVHNMYAYDLFLRWPRRRLGGAKVPHRPAYTTCTRRACSVTYTHKHRPAVFPTMDATFGHPEVMAACPISLRVFQSEAYSRPFRFLEMSCRTIGCLLRFFFGDVIISGSDACMLSPPPRLLGFAPRTSDGEIKNMVATASQLGSAVTAGPLLIEVCFLGANFG